mmetsp:Transcript_6469/g.19605  ORF Transcript_6469/g.19605 Transcript_6469/m.19605 type:complete len:221 (+) Transcript_6469:1320-1982(+)
MSSGGSSSAGPGCWAPRRTHVTMWTRQTNSRKSSLPSRSRSECSQATMSWSLGRRDRSRSTSASLPSTYPSPSQSVRLKREAYFLFSRLEGAQRARVKGLGEADREAVLAAAVAACRNCSSPAMTGCSSENSLPPPWMLGDPEPGGGDTSEGARRRCRPGKSGSTVGSTVTSCGSGICPAWACATNLRATKKPSVFRKPWPCLSAISQTRRSTSCGTPLP